MAGQQIPMAIRKVTNGGVWLEQSPAERVFEQSLSRRIEANAGGQKIAALTPREHEVIQLICRGMRNKEISKELRSSAATVSHHLTSIYRKLGVEDRTSLVIYAAKQHLVTF